MFDKNNKNNNNYFYLGYGISFGLIIGAGLGMFFNNIAIGSGFGMLIGITIGTLMDYNKNK